MGNKIEKDIQRLKEAIGPDINSLKANIPSPQKATHLAIFEGFLWGIQKLTRPDKLTDSEKVRLQQMLEQCADSNRPDDQLQRAAMEISIFAPPDDPHSAAALSGLLNHSSRHVRNNALKSLARVGGEQAKQKLEELANSKDPEVKEIARESLYYCQTNTVARKNIKDIGRQMNELIDLLSPKYSSKVVFICSAGFFITFVTALVAWHDFRIRLIHPALSVIGAVMCAGLAAISIWRYKCR